MSKHKKHTQHKTKEKKPKIFLEKVKDYYIHDYKKLFIIPLILFIISALILFNTYTKTGDFIKRDVSLKGGMSITITTDFSDIAGLENHLNSNFPTASLNIRTVESRGKITGIIVEASDLDETLLIQLIGEKVELTKENYSVESMGSALGDSFFKQMFIAVLIAFVSMGFVFQFYFKNIYATFAALFSAFMDIFITIGIMDLLGLRLTAGGIAAYLMLIGYSIDTSILISTKLLKEQKELKTAIFGAMKTGFTMSAAGIAAVGISFALTNNTTLKQIMLILLVGLIIDLVTTWIGNVAFLRYYMERQKK